MVQSLATMTLPRTPGPPTPENPHGLRIAGSAPAPVAARIAPVKRELDAMVDLAAAAAKGDRGAFEAIHKRLAGGLHRLFMDRANGKYEVADDLGQRTWLAVWDSLQRGRYDPSRSAITTFVYAVGYKMWLQYLRTASRPETLVSDVHERAGDELNTPEFETGMAELLQAVRTCLKNENDNPVLTEEERGIVRASAAGASDRDIAKQLGVAASTLNARKQAAFDKIRRYLAGKGHRSEKTEQVWKKWE